MAKTAKGEASNVPRCPLVVCSTILPKVPLSYRWVINDARTFLRNGDTVLTSPSFSVSLPLKSYKEAFWRVVVQRDFANCVICLKYDPTATGHEKPHSKVLISECSMSVLNPRINTVLFSRTVSDTECEIGGSTPTTLECTMCKYSELAKYIFNNALTIQINATICCVSDPKLKEEELRKVPLDDIRKELNTLYRDKVFADVTIKCADQEFKVHKAVLASQSPVFRKMFEVEMKEKTSNLVEISDIDPVVISDLLAYIYSGEAPNLKTLARKLLDAADKYDLPRLLAMCVNELQKQLKVDDVVDVLMDANLHNIKELKAVCLQFINLHYSEVKCTSGWKLIKDNAEVYSSLLAEIMERLE